MDTSAFLNCKKAYGDETAKKACDTLRNQVLHCYSKNYCSEVRPSTSPKRGSTKWWCWWSMIRNWNDEPCAYVCVCVCVWRCWNWTDNPFVYFSFSMMMAVYLVSLGLRLGCKGVRAVLPRGGEQGQVLAECKDGRKGLWEGSETDWKVPT